MSIDVPGQRPPRCLVAGRAPSSLLPWWLRLLGCLFLFQLTEAVMPQTLQASEPEGSVPEKPQRRRVRASSLAARFEVLEAHEKAALAERSKSFGRYHAQVAAYLTDEMPWYIHRGDLVVDGDFDNDLLLVVDGDLTVRGVYNDYFVDDGGLLLCLGDVRAEHVLSWNAFCAVGSLYAAGLVYAYYNDFPFEVYGRRLQARALVLHDKSSWLPELRLVEVSKDDERITGEIGRVFSVSALQHYDGDLEEIDVERAQALRASGQKVHVDIGGNWDVLSAATYAGNVFAAPVSFPAAPEASSDDELRLALLQPGAPEGVLKAALARPALALDLALAPAATPELLSALARDGADARLLRAAASHPATAAEVLGKLAESPDEMIRVALILNPSCTPDLAASLIGDASPRVRRALAASPLAAPHLQRLVADPDEGVRRAVASHGGLELAQRRQLLVDPSEKVRRRALNYLPVTVELVRELAASETPELRAWATKHAASAAAGAPGGQGVSKGLGEEEIQNLFLDPALEVREAALRNHRPSLRFFERHMERFSRDESGSIRRATAEVCRNPEILARLAQDPDRDVRIAVARNIATQPEVLAGLARGLAESTERHRDFGMSPREEFASRLMENPMLPAAAFQQIARFFPRAYSMEPHPNLPLDLFLSYESYDDPYDPGDREYEDLQKARELLGKPVELLSHMARSSRFNFVQMAALNPQTPPAVLLELTQRPGSESIHESLAANAVLGSETPEAASLIARLLAHEDPDVIRALLSNPHLPREVLEREAHRDPERAAMVLWLRHGIELAR